MGTKRASGNGEVTIYDPSAYHGRMDQLGDPAIAVPFNDRGNPLILESWTDLAVSALQGAGAAALVQDDFPNAGSPFQSIFTSHLANDQLSFTAQMPHSWDKGPIRPHLHVYPCANPAAPEVARFQILYAWNKVGSRLPLSAAWTALIADLTINPGDYSPVTGAIEKIVSFGLVTPPIDAVESSLFLWVVTRLGLDAGDTYTTNKTWETLTANLAIQSVDIHYQIEKIGSSPEFP